MTKPSINSGSLTYCASLITPLGCESVILSEGEALSYQADPDNFAASHYGLKLGEYQEWLDMQGAALCSARTKEGALCKNQISPIQQEADAWKRLHRNGRCHAHE